MARSLLARPADLGYVAFLVIHLIASVLVDGQAFYPDSLVPAGVKKVRTDYLRDSADPLLGNAFHPRYAWFGFCLITEMVLQVPAFAAGAYGLIKDDKRYYPLLIAYASWATLSTSQCIVTVLYGEEARSLSPSNMRTLLTSYVPFTIVPALMLVDLTVRTARLLAHVQSPKAKTS